MSTYTADIQLSVNELIPLAGADYDIAVLSSAIPQAVSVIETVSGVLFDSEFRDAVITKGDAGWLKKAAAYQALFLLENTDTNSRPAVESMTQDGVHVQAFNELTFVLAPLAKRALANCSWGKSGTMRVSLENETAVEDFLVSDNHPWTPLAGV